MTWRDLFRRATDGREIADCEGCGMQSVRVITCANVGFWRGAWLWLLGSQEFDAWCEPCHHARNLDAGSEWIWWLPVPMTAAWETFDPVIDGAAPGCCGCGAVRGPGQVAVWGPEEGQCPGDFELYCLPCWDDMRGGFYPGCTFAFMPEACTWAELSVQGALAYPQRQLVSEAVA